MLVLCLAAVLLLLTQPYTASPSSWQHGIQYRQLLDRPESAAPASCNCPFCSLGPCNLAFFRALLQLVSFRNCFRRRATDNRKDASKYTPPASIEQARARPHMLALQKGLSFAAKTFAFYGCLNCFLFLFYSSFGAGSAACGLRKGPTSKLAGPPLSDKKCLPPQKKSGSPSTPTSTNQPPEPSQL